MYDIVAVDDEQSIRRFLNSLFALQGWNFKIFDRGEDALAFLRENPARIVLTDINMPNMHGAQFARQVREIYPDIPLLAFTGSVTETDLPPADFTHMIPKPCAVDSMVRILQDFLPDSTHAGQESSSV